MCSCALACFSLSLSFSFSTQVFFMWWFGIVRKVLSTSRSKMLPDNYSGSKFDNRKPSVKRSARHHHQQQRQRQQRDRFLFCTVTRCGERERERTQSNNNNNREKRGRKTNDSIRKRREPKWNLSLFSYTNARTDTREQNKNERSETTTCALYFSSYLYISHGLFWLVRVILEYDVNASCEVRRFFFFEVSLLEKNFGTLNVKLEFSWTQRPGLKRKAAEKKNSHTPTQQWA